MNQNFTFGDSLPIAPLGIIAMDSCLDLGQKVNDYIVQFRKNDYEVLMNENDATLKVRGYDRDNYLIQSKCSRFGSGEAKGRILSSVRGSDLYIMTDVLNYSQTYKMFGTPNRMSPDDHFADLKRVIQVAESSSHRVNVIMPFLYESRQHKKSGRESLDCAYALQELKNMGVSSITTFDAHDPRVQNAFPTFEFNNFMPTYQFIKAMFKAQPDIKINKDNVMVISPDEGAMGRAVYLATNLGVDVGMFYKRRDYTKVVDGRNPIVAHEFLGQSVEGKTVIIVDDMISSGESMLDCCKTLKNMKAAHTIIMSTFGLFTDGFEKFDEFHANGYIDCCITTNLNYRPAEIYDKPWYVEADMSKFLASIINNMNHDFSISELMTPTKKIQKSVALFNEGKYVIDED